MAGLTVGELFSHYIWEPGALPKRGQRAVAWATTIAVGIPSLGLAQAASYFFYKRDHKARVITLSDSTSAGSEESHGGGAAAEAPVSRVEAIRAAILATVAPGRPSEAEDAAARDQTADRVINNLWLGCWRGLFGVMGLERVQRGVSPETLKTFKTVVTACPWSEVAAEIFERYGMTITEADATTRLQERGVRWIQVGKAVYDDSSYWKELVRDCTLPESPPADAGVVDMDTLPVERWFEAVFTHYDRAVFSDEVVLTHCVAGKSRSPTILAAYIINRFGVTAEQAIGFLRSKRLCVAPRFVEYLEAYSVKLRETARIHAG